VRRGVDFALRRAGSIEVRLAGTPSDQSWYQARAFRIADGKETLAHTVYLGTWSKAQTIRSLSPGRYKLVLTRGGNTPGSPLEEIETDVVPGETSRVSFQAK
jgi:hypothetical protein